MLARIRRMWDRTSDEGASAVEYGLLVAAIAAAIAVIVFAIGGMIRNAFTETCDQLGEATGAAAADTADCAGPAGPAGP